MSWSTDGYRQFFPLGVAWPVSRFASFDYRDYVEDGLWNDPEFLESLRRYGTKVTLAEGEARSVPLKITALTVQQ